MNTSLYAVVTTIQQPTASLSALNRRLAEYGGVLVAAGDRKGPAEFDLPGTVFLDLHDQVKGPFELARQLPTGHYARKNIGYLEAMRQGAACIYETDDDNAPLDSWAPRSETVSNVRVIPSNASVTANISNEKTTEHAEYAEISEVKAEKLKIEKTEIETENRECSGFQHFSVSAFSPKWTNVYRYFTDEHIWPRGFPLDQIHNSLPNSPNSPNSWSQDPISAFQRFSVSAFPLKSPIQQGLVNGSPDVDAIWRLTLDRPFSFEDRPSVYLEPGNWCPFNTQSTWWWPVAYPLLYVPSHCSFRMCDIWKSFIAQRCLWALGFGVTFHPPEVFQDRNPHDYLKDFEAEVPGYLQNNRIARLLGGLELDSAPAAVGDNLRACYRLLVGEGILPAEELPLVDAWLSDLAAIREIAI